MKSAGISVPPHETKPHGASERAVLGVLAVLGAAYFGMFLFPNWTGARDPSMISIFEPDEFTQFSYLRAMLAFDHASVLRNIYSLIAYGHYYYGYPFYLGSALVAIPVKLAMGMRNNATQTYLLVLRQLLSVLPMVLAALGLTYAQTRFRRYLSSIATFVLLLAIPAVVQNSMWWHPDSLVLLFIVVTLVFLDRDDLKFGRNFLLAAVFCGLATGTKLLGLFFFLAIPAYILMGVRSGALNWKMAALKAGQFVGCMLAAIIASNPFLLLPAERAEMLRIQSGQAAAMSSGWVLQYAKGPAAWLPMIGSFYGPLIVYALALAALLYLIIARHPRQVLAMMILLWAVPLSVYLLFAIATKPTHFLLPVALPLMSCLPVVAEHLLRRLRISSVRGWTPGHWARAVGAALLCSVMVYQFVWSVSSDIPLYREVLYREESNNVLQLYTVLNRDYLSGLPAGQRLVVYRDVRAYFPESGNRRVQSFFNTTTYQRLEKINPDIVLLWRQRVLDYTNENALQSAVEPGAFDEIYAFFADARQGTLRGYRLLYQNPAGMAFVREDLYERYFAP